MLNKLEPRDRNGPSTLSWNCLVAGSYSRRFTMMAAAVLLSPFTAKPRLFGIAGAIGRHASRRGSNRGRRDNCRGWRLDDNLGWGRRNISGSAAGFPGRFVARRTTANNE